jgi:flagellin
MRDLAVQSSNTGSSDSVARNAAAEEVKQGISEISRIASTTRFGNVSLFSGYSGVFQVGANADPNSQITVDIGTVSTGATGAYALDLQGSTIGRYGIDVASSGIALAGTAATAATVTGTAAPATNYSTAGQATTFNLSVDGGAAVAITLDQNYGTAAGVANAINTQFGSNVATINGAGRLVLSSGTTGSSSNVTITGLVENTALSGLANSNVNGTNFAAGTNNVALTLNGGAATTVNLNSFDFDGDNSLSGSELAAGFNTISGVSASFLDGKLTLTSETPGSSSAVSLGTGNGAGTSIVGGTADTTTDGVAALVSAGSNGGITRIDNAISKISSLRANLGAYQNRFESTIANLQVTTENLSASESRIRDTDVALEMVSFTRSNILMQAGTAMLAQANQLPQSVLRLLG